MELARLLTALSDPAAYPHLGGSAADPHLGGLLGGGPGLQREKPVDFGFLDFRSLEQRRHFCEEAVRLHRTDDVVEWAVEKGRLHDEATLPARLRGGTAGRPAGGL